MVPSAYETTLALVCAGRVAMAVADEVDGVPVARVVFSGPLSPTTRQIVRNMDEGTRAMLVTRFALERMRQIRARDSNATEGNNAGEV